MVRNTYGKTAWGKSFLDALSRLDRDKRLDRGRSYANTGKVGNMVIEDPGRVNARVFGSEMYRVSVTFSELSASDKVTVCEVIEQNMMILAQIMCGELPDQLSSLLTQSGISLVPFSWSDLSASCSCPDYANPCKHMAAVYFSLTTHIDQDPFTLFRLRGLNLLSVFGIKQTDVDPGYPLNTDELDESQGDVSLPPALSRCPVVNIPDMSSFILGCLKSNPPYCLQLDFKHVLTEFYSFCGKKSVEFVGSLSEVRSGHWSADLDLDNVWRLLSHSLIIMPLNKYFSSPHLLIFNEIFEESDTDGLAALGSIPHSVQKIPIDHNSVTVIHTWVKLDLLTAMQVFLLLSNDFGSPSYIWFYHAFRVVVSLINANAFIPDVLPIMYTDNKIAKFKIIWKPLYTCEKVSSQLTHLYNIFPVGYNVVNLDNTPLSALPSTLHLMSSVFTLYVHSLKFQHKRCKQNPPKESLVFFTDYTFKRVNRNEEKTAKAIAKEFMVFDLLKLNFAITVTLSPLPKPEEGAEYSLSISLRHRDDEGPGQQIKHFTDKNPDLKLQVLKLMATLHPYLPQLSQLLTSPAVQLSHTQLEQFVLDSATVFSNLGVTVDMPKELRELLKPDAVLLATSTKSLESVPDKYLTFLKLADLLSFDWKICLGEDTVDFAEFERLVASGRKLVRYKDKFISVSAEEVKKLMKARPKRKVKLTSLEIIRETLSGNSLVRFTSDVDRFLKGLMRITDHPVPSNLEATLRPYQVAGYRWMLSNLLNGFGVVLADDMGLGKTIQTISVLLYLKNTGRLTHSALIIVPASVLSNWMREIKRFAPSLSVTMYYGADRQISECTMKELSVTDQVVKPEKKPTANKAAKTPTDNHASDKPTTDNPETKPLKYSTAEIMLSDDDMDTHAQCVEPAIKHEIKLESKTSIKQELNKVKFESKSAVTEDEEIEHETRTPIKQELNKVKLESKSAVTKDEVKNEAVNGFNGKKCEQSSSPDADYSQV